MKIRDAMVYIGFGPLDLKKNPAREWTDKMIDYLLDNIPKEKDRFLLATLIVDRLSDSHPTRIYRLCSNGNIEFAYKRKKKAAAQFTLKEIALLEKIKKSQAEKFKK